MLKAYILKIQRLSFTQVIFLLLSLSLFCPQLWAAQEAMVVVPRAVIYSDLEMTSPIGYVSRGKKVLVGEIPRNKGQVYPIEVSGKIAFIKVLDLSTEREAVTANRLTAERFLKAADTDPKTKFVVSYFAYSTQVNIKENANGLLNKQDLLWNGVSLKGEVLVGKRFDIQLITNAMTATEGDTNFKAVELGLGGAYRILNFKRLLLRLEAQALSVPFSSYEVGNDFRVKSYGYTLGAGANLTILLGEHWGLEAFGGIYQTSIFGFKAPDPYQKITPTFAGNRFGLGINLSY